MNFGSRWESRLRPQPGGGAAIWTFTLDSTVRDWKVEDLTASLTKVDRGRSLANGQKVFKSASCLACHATDAGAPNVQGKLAPSLTEISQKVRDGKLDRAGLLTEIIQPSHQIDKQYRTNVVTTADGRLISGVVLHEDDEVIRLLSNPLNPGERAKEVAKKDVDERAESKVSLMPLGLLNTLSEEEILDLLGYLEAGGAE